MSIIIAETLKSKSFWKGCAPMRLVLCYIAVVFLIVGCGRKGPDTELETAKPHTEKNARFQLDCKSQKSEPCG